MLIRTAHGRHLSTSSSQASRELRDAKQMDNTPKRQRPRSPVRPVYVEDTRDRHILLELARRERRVQELKEQLVVAEAELETVRSQVIRSSPIMEEHGSTRSLFADIAQPPLDPTIVLTRIAEGSRSIFGSVLNDLKELGAATLAPPQQHFAPQASASLAGSRPPRARWLDSEMSDSQGSLRGSGK